MLFNDSIKKHWLEQIELLGDRFNPDCGTRPPRWEGGEAAPINLLTGLYNDDSLWTSFEKEFQIPRWILELVDDYMHNISPTTSYEVLKRVFSVCPTYVDLDLLYHKFSQRILMYLIVSFSDIPAQLRDDTYFGSVWVNLLINEKRLLARLSPSSSLLVNIQTDQCLFECWGEPSNPYLYFSTSVSAIQNKYTGCWVECLRELHKLNGEIVEDKLLGDTVLDMLLETLEDA